jgi:hypothetical protein
MAARLRLPSIKKSGTGRARKPLVKRRFYKLMED